MPQLIEELAAGMAGLVVDPERYSSDHWLEFTVAAGSPPDLVVDTLGELLYRSETADAVVCEVSVDEDVGALGVAVRAGTVDAQTVELAGPPIKGVTYHDLVVREEDGGWYGRVYFDV